MEMEKKEVQVIVKEKLKSYGFKSRGNNHYKMIEDDYMVGVSLDHHPFRKAYFIEYGGVFLPDEKKVPFCGFYDWMGWFLFTQNAEDNLEQLEQCLEKDIWGNGTELLDYFEYDKKDKDSLIEALNINVEKKLLPIFDKEYILNDYRNDIDSLVTLPPDTVKKILKYGDFDMEEVEYQKKKSGKDW